MVKRIKSTVCLMMCVTGFHTAIANTEAENNYLIQMINQLDELQPLIMAAEKAQAPNQRISFHYQRYWDNQGDPHNGLLEDVQAVKAGVVEHLNSPVIEPRLINPLQGDYLNLHAIDDREKLNATSNSKNTPMTIPTFSTTPPELLNVDHQP